MLLSPQVLSPQFERLQQLGQTRPTPAFGPLTLVKYVSIWPKGGSERHELRSVVAAHLSDDEGIAKGFIHARKEYRERYERFLSVVNKLLLALQARGSWHPENDHVKFEWANAPFGYPSEFEDQLWFAEFAPGGPKHHEDFKDEFWWFPQLVEDTLAFTISWFPGAQPGKGALNGHMVDHGVKTDTCARIRVHAEVHSEHINLAFYMELEGKADSATAGPSFIRKIRDAADHFTTNAAKRLDDLEVTENPVSGGPNQTELDCADTLFDTVWANLFKDFGIDFSAVIKPAARAFNSHRGVVIASNGYAVGGNVGDPGTVKSNRFGDPPQQLVDKEGGRVHRQPYVAPPPSDPHGREWATEPLAVTKAHWNIIRCLGDVPEQREFIATKVYGRRALFFSPLGSMVQRADAVGHTRTAAGHNRFVVVTCGQPNRESCGRLVDRLMSIMAAKAMALRDWSIIADAGEHAVVRGRQLDGIVEHWVTEKTRLSQTLIELEDKLQPLKIAERQEWKKEHRRWRAFRRSWTEKWEKWEPVWDLEDQVTSTSLELSRHMIASDNLLGRLMQEVNSIGRFSSGGLPYRLFKARHFAHECMRLVGSLEMEAMDGWVSLEQSFKRGLQTIFDTIALMHDRIDSLRSRIQLVTEMVQTGASFEQQRKTSENTDEFRRISRNSEILLQGIEGNTFVKKWIGIGSIALTAGTGFLGSWLWTTFSVNLAWIVMLILVQVALIFVVLRSVQ